MSNQADTSFNSMQNSLVIEPTNKAQSSVIWLHGLRVDGHNFKGLIPQFNLPEKHHIRFIFPHAPMRSTITVNNGEKMRGWYETPNVLMILIVMWTSQALKNRLLV